MTPQSSLNLGDLTAAQLGFTVSGRTLFALTLEWDARLAVLREAEKRYRGLDAPVAALGAELAIATLEGCIDEVRTLMAASIPAATVGLS